MYIEQIIEHGWRSGESTCLPLLWPGFDSWIRRHTWVEFVIGSRPCSEGFSPGSLVFFPPQKPTLQILIRSRNESDGNSLSALLLSVTLTK